MKELLKPLYDIQLNSLNNLYSITDIELDRIKEVLKVAEELEFNITKFDSINQLRDLQGDILIDRDFVQFSIILMKHTDVVYNYEDFKDFYSELCNVNHVEVCNIVIYTSEADLEEVFSIELDDIVYDPDVLDDNYSKTDLIHIIIEEQSKKAIKEELIDNVGIVKLLMKNKNIAYYNNDDSEVYYDIIKH